MTSWAVVADVWFLEPQRRREGESAVDFAARVKEMIARRANLKNTDWDGYMKHYKPSPRFMQERQAQFAAILKERLAAAAVAAATTSSTSSLPPVAELPLPADASLDIGAPIDEGDEPESSGPAASIRRR